MKVSISDVASTGTVSVTSDSNALATAANMIDPSFSTKYTSAGTNLSFTTQWTAPFGGKNVSYVAVSGHNVGTYGNQITFQVTNGSGTTNYTKTILAGSGNHVVFATFPETTAVSQIVVSVGKDIPGRQITITSISIGRIMDIPNGGEQAGYSRLWLTRNKEQRVTTNDAAGPVGILSRAISRKGTLSVQHAPASFVEGSDWQSFLDHVFNDGYFFIKEQDGGPVTADSYPVITDDPQSSYLCFDADVKVKAHPQTRQLHSFDVSFSAYTGV